MTDIARFRLPPHRVAAIILLSLAGGLIGAFIYARGEHAGSDAYAYWTAVQRWLAGQDIYAYTPGLYVPPSEGALPYAYAPWTLYAFLPWALLPWDVAWVAWRAANLALFGATVMWAYQRRPLGTAAIIALLAPSLAANFDTGNVNVLLALTPWVAYLFSARVGGLLWGLGAALKWVSAPLMVFHPRAAWRYGPVVIAVGVLLTLATWPATLRQLDIVLDYPRPLRIDYLVLGWAIVPWLYARSWPPRLTRDWILGREPPGAPGPR